MSDPTPRRRGLLNSAATFFTGIGAGPAPASAKKDDKDPEPKADDDEEAKRAKREERRKARNKKAGREEDDDGEDGPIDDDDDDEEDRGDDEADDDDMKKASARAIRLRERGRVASVMQHLEAKGRENAALSLLLNSTMTRSAIITTLRTLPKEAPPAAAKPGLAERNQAISGVRIGVDAPALTAQEKIISSWDAVVKKVAITDRR